MTRRFSESQLAAASPVADATPATPGFVACSVSSAPGSLQQFWHAVYQAAFAQAVKKAMEDNTPTRYQRLVYQVSQN